MSDRFVIHNRALMGFTMSRQTNNYANAIITGLVYGETVMSWQVKQINGNGNLEWLPKSYARVIERDERNITLEVPKWLLRKQGFSYNNKKGIENEQHTTTRTI